jgi:phosphoglycolate phosphatase
MLILFDIDGTLLLDDAYAHGAAMEEALAATFRLSVPHGAVMEIDPYGMTDPAIARAVLGHLGVAVEPGDPRLDDWAADAGERFAGAAPHVLREWTVRPGCAEGLDGLRAAGHRLALVTGNLRAIAWAKLEAIGIADRFDADGGAYGSDDEPRPALVALARRRAGAPGGPWPAADTALVGDTPADAAAAAADGVRAILFASPRVAARAGAPELGAARVIGGMDELAMALGSSRGASGR